MTEWPRVPYVGVGCIVIRDGRVLLIRRHGLHGAGSWSPPGGHLGLGESPVDCAGRELYEETGVTASDMRFVAIINDVFEAENKHYITVWMRGMPDEAEGEIRAPEEVAEIGRFDINQLPSPLFLCFENLVAGQGLPRCKPGEALKDLLAGPR